MSTRKAVPWQILLIEDNDDHAELMEFYLGECVADLAVKRLSDGDAAMRYLKAVHAGDQPMPWLILLDLKLPKYDGHEILAYVKNTGPISKIPVVVFTTSDSSKDISRALENHANSYITKPMEPDRYGVVIGEMLAYWKLNQHALALAKAERDA